MRGSAKWGDFIKYIIFGNTSKHPLCSYSQKINPFACSNLDHRREMRERAWSQQGWPETVVKTARLADLMDASIMTPLSWSPLK